MPKIEGLQELQQFYSNSPWLGSFFAPWFNANYNRDRKALFASYINAMVNRVLGMFEWKGLPDTIPQETLEKFLIGQGYAIITKVPEKEQYRGNIVRALQHLWKRTENSVYMSAAYFVPGQGGLEHILREEDSGVHMTIVTNSLASTNAPTVYAKWEKYRKQLIESGAEVYEFMVSAENLRGKEHDRERKQSSFSVLHSKTMVFDDAISWIGSFNLDPRSAYYNTENVAIFESEDFANKLREMIIRDTKTSWRVTLDENNNPIWTGSRPGDTQPQVHKHAPDTSVFRRIWKSICNLVPEKFV